MKDFTMVIPSYWGRAGKELISSEKIVFAHPTPLNENGTLARLLDSLDVLEGMEGKIVVIAVANNPEIAAEVGGKVESPLDIAQALIETDETGRSYIKLPAPSADTLKKVADILYKLSGH